MRALIVGHAQARGALAAARALADAGWVVGVASPGERGLAAASRAVQFRHRLPALDRGLDRFVPALQGAIEQGGYEVVFGSGDGAALALSAERARIPAVVPYPSHATVVRAHDKLELAAAGAEAGLAVPRTELATEGALESCDLPVVVKSRMHELPSPTSQLARIDPRIAESRCEAARCVAEVTAAGGTPLLQQMVVGRLSAVVTVVGRTGDMIGTVQQLADRVWPPNAGVTSRGRTVTSDPRLLERILALLKSLGWFGLAELQFLTPPEGEPHLVDFNGRFYGSLALAVASGSNLPAVWAAIATDRRPPATRPEAGILYQWLEGDLRRALKERKGGLVSDLLETVAFARHANHSIWSRRDPWPATDHLLRVPARVARRAISARSA